jgi:hypothetical protein
MPIASTTTPDRSVLCSTFLSPLKESGTAKQGPEEPPHDQFKTAGIEAPGVKIITTYSQWTVTAGSKEKAARFYITLFSPTIPIPPRSLTIAIAKD